MVKKIGLFISADHLLDEPSKLRTFLDQISRVFPQAHQMQLISIVDREQVASLKNIKWEHLTLLESPKRLKGRKAAKEAVKFLNHRPLDLITILRSQNKDSWSFWVGSFAETMVYFSQYPILIWPYLNYQIAKNFRCLYALDPHGCDVTKLKQFIELGRKNRWDIVALVVLEPWFFNPDVDQKSKKQRGELQKNISEFERLLKTKVAGELIIKKSLSGISQTILETADELNAQLIVVHHEVRGLKRFLVGSVTSQLLQGARRPILIL